MQIICPNPNCSYQGEPAKRSRGSVLAFILLLLIGALPGIIYAIAYSGYYLVCPTCGVQVGVSEA